jgi:peptide/nickel transport system substrate-binding protein
MFRRAAGTTAVALSLAGLLVLGTPSQALAADLTAAISVDVFSTDPHKSYAANDYLLLANVYESLYGHDEKGKLIPTLATGVEIKDMGLTYEFTLRPNVRFHNGNVLTAEDVRFSWQRAVEPARGLLIHRVGRYRVDGVGRHTSEHLCEQARRIRCLSALEHEATHQRG